MTYSVVIVEDEIEVAQLLAQYLLSPDKRRANAPRYQVLGIASDLATARSVLSALNPALILLDVYLPDGSGLTLLSELRARDTNSEIMLLTAAKEVQVLEKAMQLGVCDFLVKPIMLSRLDQALSRFEEKQQHLSAAREVTQSMVDALFLNPADNPKDNTSIRLPKGVDSLTLQKVRQVFNATPEQAYTAQRIGEQLGISRSTARRYLEYLLESAELMVDQHYGAIGRPERSYRKCR
ncbi:two-component system, CitB family, response regulator [Rheinheimera pacifica]|uniref:Transcriptional regulatory protein n=1 Tax=Rheinheimera pacifica TaxID=173990 RepID=A0A1H6JQ04_9GAMM|nr:response regulator [Rheinheimera pacifica]SEH64202.1 two-component system, CitB family, response regulator [Rheinheimera pacifica]